MFLSSKRAALIASTPIELFIHSKLSFVLRCCFFFFFLGKHREFIWVQKYILTKNFAVKIFLSLLDGIKNPAVAFCYPEIISSLFYARIVNKT